MDEKEEMRLCALVQERLSALAHGQASPAEEACGGLLGFAVQKKPNKYIYIYMKGL